MTTEPTDAQANEIAAGLERRWGAATLAVDIDAMVDLFSRDVVFLGSLPTVFEGRDGVRSYMTSVDLTSTTAVTYSDRHVRVIAPDVFTSLSHVVFDVSVGGKEMAFRCAFSWVVVLEDGAWKIAQQHASTRPQG